MARRIFLHLTKEEKLYCQHEDKAKRRNCHIVVDYNLSLQAMIEAGNYDVAHEHLFNEKTFPVSGEGIQKIQLKLIKFQVGIFREYMIPIFKAAGLRPAFPAEILALGALQPELQKTKIIVALGQVGLGAASQHVVGLCGNNQERRLGLDPIYHSWFPTSYFAAVADPEANYKDRQDEAGNQDHQMFLGCSGWGW